MRGAKASCTAVGQLPKLTGQRGSKPYFGVAFGGGGGQAAAGEPGSLGVSGGWGSAGAENVESFPGKISLMSKYNLQNRTFLLDGRKDYGIYKFNEEFS